MEFRNGDKVEITIKGTIREKTGNEHGYAHRVTDDRGANHFVYLGLLGENDSLTVTRVISDWPPQPGDIWESEGKEYAAIWANREDGPNVPIHSVDDALRYEVSEFRDFPGLRLIRRRGAS